MHAIIPAGFTQQLTQLTVFAYHRRFARHHLVKVNLEKGHIVQFSALREAEEECVKPCAEGDDLTCATIARARNCLRRASMPATRAK